MKAKVKKEKMVTVPESLLLSLVADSLKDKVLFADKVENAKVLLSKIKHSVIE